jgi:hypothetical protein
VSRFAGLAEAQAYAMRIVDEAAERARLRYITPGAGQAMEYEAAQREAEAFLRNGAGARPVYPMLQADVDAGLAPDLQTAAAQVVAARGQWEAAGAIIRRHRLEAKRLIAEASAQREVAERRETAVATLAQL